MKIYYSPGIVNRETSSVEKRVRRFAAGESPENHSKLNKKEVKHGKIY